MGKTGPEGGATGGERGSLILLVLSGLVAPLATFFNGGEGLFWGVFGTLGAIPGGLGATFGLP